MTIGAAVLYPLALVTVALLLRFVGERWWLTGVALYLPRLPLGLPLVVLVPALWLQKLRRWLVTQALAAYVLLFPLLGLVLPGWHSKSTAPSVRILSYNVNSCQAGYAAVANAVLREEPDIVVMQELIGDARPLVALLAPKYPTVDVSEQFVMASRFRLRAKTKPPVVNYLGYLNTPHVVRYEFDTPLGPLAVVSVHPISPRKAIRALQRGVRGFPWARSGTDEWQRGGNAETRAFELGRALDLAREEKLPVVIAGDTNLPKLSPLLGRLEDGYRDGFERAGWGFGYTFPSRIAWLRLDRILASPELDFAGFGVDCGRASDHRCVFADVIRR